MSADAKKLRAIERLLRPVEDFEDANDEDDDGGGPRGSRSIKAKPDQLRYYDGVQRSIIEEARDMIRLFLFTVMPFPTNDILTVHCRQFYVAACQERYKSKFKGEFQCYVKFCLY